MTTRETSPRSSNRATDIIVGLSDGLTVPFALATGMSAVTRQGSTIIYTVAAAIVLSGIAMGLSRYYGGMMEGKHHDFTEDEAAGDMDFDEVSRRAVADELLKEKGEWEAHMAAYEAEDITNPTVARRSGVNISLAYMAGGAVPLCPYLLLDIATARLYSIIITLACLFIFGYFKAKFTGLPPLSIALKAVVFGAIAALAAYAVATLFR